MTVYVWKVPRRGRGVATIVCHGEDLASARERLCSAADDVPECLDFDEIRAWVTAHEPAFEEEGESLGLAMWADLYL